MTPAALTATATAATSTHGHRSPREPGFGGPGDRKLAGLPLEDRPVGSRRDVDPNGAIGPVLVVLRQPFSHLGRAHPNHGIPAGLVFGTSAEYVGPDNPFAKEVVFTGERVFDYVRQKALALTRGPERRALKYVAQGFPDPNCIGVRNDFGVRLWDHRQTALPPSYQVLYSPWVSFASYGNHAPLGVGHSKEPCGSHSKEI